MDLACFQFLKQYLQTPLLFLFVFLVHYLSKGMSDPAANYLVNELQTITLQSRLLGMILTQARSKKSDFSSPFPALISQCGSSEADQGSLRCYVERSTASWRMTAVGSSHRSSAPGDGREAG